MFWPSSVFVDRNNTVYVTDMGNDNVKEWRAGSTNFTRTTFNSLRYLLGLFVTTDGIIYVDNSFQGTVEKWTLNATESTAVMNVTSQCYALFVDIDNNLYCSFYQKHQVVKQRLDTDGNVSQTIIAGIGVCGSDQNMLCRPLGIFVTIKLDLYVADCVNNRIQLFQSGQLTGKTVVGDMETSGIKLNRPTSVILDADGYLFIVDSENNRIIRPNSDGFYCVVACSTVRDSASNQLNVPFAAAFDNVGNILVIDRYHYQVQKFMLMANIDGM